MPHARGLRRPPGGLLTALEVNEMHAIHPDHRPVLAAVLAVVLAFVLALAAAPTLSDLDWGGSTAAPVTADTPANPVWATDPLAPPALLREAR
jgi:hypothetical protein